MPKVLNGPVLILIIDKESGTAMCFCNKLLLPMGIISVLSRLICNQEYFPNYSNSLIASPTDFISFSMRLVSSANNLILNILPLTASPLILLLSLKLIAIISATIRNRRAEIGQPCLIPLVKLK